MSLFVARPFSSAAFFNAPISLLTSQWRLYDGEMGTERESGALGERCTGPYSLGNGIEHSDRLAIASVAKRDGDPARRRTPYSGPLAVARRPCGSPAG